MKGVLCVYDLIAETRALYGDRADEILDRLKLGNVPESDWRFEFISTEGWPVAFAAGSTAYEVGSYLTAHGAIEPRSREQIVKEEEQNG